MGEAVLEQDQSSSTKMRILVVDDMPENRFAFQQILKGERYAVDLAGSANQALSMLLKHEYACVLSDVQMPGMDGVEFLEIMRRDPDCGEVPVILITAHSFRKERLRKAFEYDAFDFLSKPVDPDVLRGKLRAFASLHRKKLELKEQVVATRQAQAELHDANITLQRSNEDLERFAYIASHDLQEPLRKVASFCQILKEDYAAVLDERGNKFLDYAVDGATRMKSMIMGLLEFSRTGRGEHDAEPCNPATVIEEVIESMSLQLTDTGAKVHVGGLPLVIVTNPMLFGRLVQNLLSNAVKYQREGESPEVSIECSSQDDCWRFDVIDNGIGIAEESKLKVFGFFERLHARGKYDGVGIGLAVCKRIVEDGGGEIWLESEVGSGSTFHFTLPKSMSK